MDNFEFEEFIHDSFRFENMNSTNQKMAMDEEILKVDLIDGDPEYFSIVRTEPISVRENSVYKYTITVDLQNITDFKAYTSTVRTDDVVQNSRKYGGSASNGNILVLTPGSEVLAELDILKSSNYTLAVRTDSCETCTPLKLTIEDEKGNSTVNNGNISRRDSSNSNSNTSRSELEWLYLNNIYLNQGHYKIKIYSDSQRDLDSVILYSSSIENDTHNEFETLNDVFNISAAPAYITEYSKIDPTKYTIKISNATRPYILSFAESYDPLWAAYITDNSSGNSTDMNSSIPLYSIINGFYIDGLGDYSITIEFRPQQWFIQGVMVSIATLVISLGIYFLLQKRKVLQLFPFKKDGKQMTELLE
jgi:hypothetical protein